MKAYVAVQKRLLLMAFALWRNQLDYDPLYLANRVGQDKKIVPTSGTTQDQPAVAELSYL
jgi:transposase